ncbi:MAG: nickel pincer cofactor biosynthesis protein LarB [Aureliella sp.]
MSSEHPSQPKSPKETKPTQIELEQWLAKACEGELSWSELAERLLRLEYAAGSAHRPDIDRSRRCGFGEVIYGSGKSAEDIDSIARRLLEAGQAEVLVTRVDHDIAKQLQLKFSHSHYDSVARTLRLAQRLIIKEDAKDQTAVPCSTPSSSVIILTAGSTDLPVAREALETLHWMGIATELICDVGVAGPYRLLPHLQRLRDCVCVVVVAGMEGALASVVGGLVAAPIIAVPTSVGYGANLEGITTLLSMISSCAAGVTVVNIDAGFKGGYVAGLIASRTQQKVGPKR